MYEDDNYVTSAQLQQQQQQQRDAMKREKNQRNANNNANALRTAADIASKTAEPHAKAIGTAVKVADKLTGGKALNAAGKAMNFANKMTPHGRMQQALINKIGESGMTKRLGNAMANKQNNAIPTNAKPGKNTNAISPGKDNSNFSKREVEEQTSDGGGSSFSFTVKVIKTAMIAMIPIMVVVVFMNLFVSASQTYLSVIGLDQADEIDNEEADKKIREKGSEGLDEEITDENEGIAYANANDIFIEDNNYRKKLNRINFIANENYDKSSLEELEDYYSDINSYKNEGYNMNTVYKFFFKLLYIQKHYKKNYNIDLDMPLIMSILAVQSEDKSKVFISNTKNYRIRNAGAEPEENPNFAYSKDWSGYSLSKNNSEYDIEILAQNMVAKTSDSGCSNTIDGACYKLVDDTEYKEFLKGFLEKKYFIEEDESGGLNSGGVSGSGSISFDESYSNGSGSMQPGIELSSEPDPSTAINYWSYVKTEDFVYPKDKQSGLPLGAWPKNYQTIPAQLENVKVYQDAYIWPLTPTSEIYTFVYEHNGMDIMAPFGSPIYSPVDGNLVYSTWGYTTNKGSDETAYSVTITPDIKVTYGGTTIDEIFFTHMSGIIYRCNWGECNRKIKKGELIGFVGNAYGNSTSVGWAPHLHLTYYNSSDYNTGLQTSILEKFYGIKSNTKIKAGE